MGVISVSLPADGTTADVGDYNTPITTIVNVINGNLDNSNIAAAAAIDGSKLANASITNAKLATTTGELGGAWNTWTPTWTNLTVGNGTVTAKYIQIGKKVTCYIKFVMGSTSVFGNNPTFTVPATAASQYGANINMVGIGHCVVAVTNYNLAIGLNASTTLASPFSMIVNGSWGNWSLINGTAPDTWTTGNYFNATFTYEAA